MKKIVFLLPVLLCSITFDSFAQLGIQAGLNFSKLSFISDEDLDAMKSKFAPGGLLGLHYNINFGDKLYLEPAFQFNVYRYEVNVSHPDYSQDSKVFALHTQIPIHLGYKINFTDNKAFKIFAGPYFSYGLTGKVTMDINDAGNKYSRDETIYFSKEKEDANVAPKSYQNPLDIGAQLGVGIDLGGIAVCAIYSHGLSNIIAHTDEPFSKEFRDNFAMKYRQLQAVVYFSFGK
ncbi:MAG: porin family protein [Cytophagaceae bacterium]